MNALGLIRTVLAAAEPTATQRAVLICVFRGSSHAERAEAFSLELDNAGIINKVEHNRIYGKYSEIRVNFKGVRSGLVVVVKKTIQLLDKHHGLFVRYFNTGSGINDVECAPRDFNKSDFEYVLEHGSQEDKFAHGAAEPPAQSKGAQFSHTFLVRPAPGKKPADVKAVMKAVYHKLAEHAIYLQYHRLPRANSGSEYECVFSSEKSDTVKANIAVMRALALSGVVSRFRLPGSAICRRPEVIAQAGDEAAYRKLAEERYNSIKDMP